MVEGFESLSGRANETLNQLSTSTWITYEAKHAKICPLPLDKMLEFQNWRALLASGFEDFQSPVAFLPHNKATNIVGKPMLTRRSSRFFMLYSPTPLGCPRQNKEALRKYHQQFLPPKYLWLHCFCHVGLANHCYCSTSPNIDRGKLIKTARLKSK